MYKHVQIAEGAPRKTCLIPSKETSSSPIGFCPLLVLKLTLERNDVQLDAYPTADSLPPPAPPSVQAEGGIPLSDPSSRQIAPPLLPYTREAYRVSPYPMVLADRSGVLPIFW